MSASLYQGSSTVPVVRTTSGNGKSLVTRTSQTSSSRSGSGVSSEEKEIFISRSWLGSSLLFLWACLAASADSKRIFALQPTNTTVLSSAETQQLTVSANNQRPLVGSLLETSGSSYFAYVGLTNSNDDGRLQLFDNSRRLRGELIIPNTKFTFVAAPELNRYTVMQQTSPKTNSFLVAGYMVKPSIVEMQEIIGSGTLSLSAVMSFENDSTDRVISATAIPGTSYIFAAQYRNTGDDRTEFLNEQFIAKFDLLLKVADNHPYGDFEGFTSLDTLDLSYVRTKLHYVGSDRVISIPLGTAPLASWAVIEVTTNYPVNLTTVTPVFGSVELTGAVGDTQNLLRVFLITSRQKLHDCRYEISTNGVTQANPELTFPTSSLFQQEPILLPNFDLIVLIEVPAAGASGVTLKFIQKQTFKVVDFGTLMTSNIPALNSLFVVPDKNTFNFSLGWVEATTQLFSESRLAIVEYCSLNDSRTDLLSSPSQGTLAGLDFKCLEEKSLANLNNPIKLVSSVFDKKTSTVTLTFDTLLIDSLVVNTLQLNIESSESNTTLTDSEYVLSFSKQNPSVVTIKLQPKQQIYSATLKIRGNTTFSPLRSQDRVRGFVAFPIEVTAISLFLDESLKSAVATAESIGQAAGGTAAVASIALVAANPGAAFFVTQIMATFVYMALIGGEVLILPSQVLASLSSPELIDLGIQTSINRSVLPETCEASELLRDNEYSCNLLLNYGSGLVSLAVTFGVSLLTHFAYKLYRSKQREAQQQQEGTTIRTGETRETRKAARTHPKWSFGWVLAGLEGTYGLQYSLMTLEAIPLELLTCVFVQLRFGDLSSGSGKVGFCLAAATLLIYLGIFTALCGLAQQVNAASSSTEQTAIPGGDRSHSQAPVDGSGQMLGSSAATDLGDSQIISDSKKDSTLKDRIDLEDLDLGIFGFVYEGYAYSDSMLVHYTPAIKMLRSIFLSFLVGVGSDWGLTQVILVLLVEAGALCALITTRPKKSKIEVGVDLSTGFICICYCLGKAITFADMTVETKQGKIGLTLSWLLIVYLSISLLYAVIMLLLSIWEIVVGMYRQCKERTQGMLQAPSRTPNMVAASQVSVELPGQATQNSWKNQTASQPKPAILGEHRAPKPIPKEKLSVNKVSQSVPREERHLFSVDTPPDDEKSEIESPHKKSPQESTTQMRVLRFRTRKNLVKKATPVLGVASPNKGSLPSSKSIPPL